MTAETRADPFIGHSFTYAEIVAAYEADYPMHDIDDWWGSLQADSSSNALVTQAMPPLPDHLCESVDIYVTVSEDGGVEFVRACDRICDAGKFITRSGRISHDMLFPGWASEIFAAVSIQMDDVLSETTVSTKWPAGDFLQVVKQPEFELDAVWSVLQ